MGSANTTSDTNGSIEIFARKLTAAWRGGLIIMAGSLFWRPLIEANQDPFFSLGFGWLSTSWLSFPVGAFLGFLLPRLVSNRGWVPTIATGILVGALAGLILAAGAWTLQSHLDLIGLITNRSSGGYEGYSTSVLKQLREHAWRALVGIAPLTCIWVAVWTLWIKDSARHFPPRVLKLEGEPAISIGIDRRLFKVVGWIAGSLSLFATALLLATALFTRGAQVPLSSFVAVGLGAVGLVILGPFLGPVATGWVFGTAIRYAAVGIPVLLAALGPFVLCRRPVRPGIAVLAWCGFITALLFWVAIGLFSLGHCLG